MTILEFMNEFPDEQSCRQDFKMQREKEGIYCKKCSSSKQYWLQNKWQWQCSSCKFRTTLRSGTIMEGSNLPVRKWYLAMIFMTFSKKGISAKELQRQLGHNRYTTIWSLMHRIRNAMGNRDSQYTLEGTVEFDETFFQKAAPDDIRLKRGKGSQKKQNVAVMAEADFLEDIETGKISKSCRYFKMAVLGSHKTESINKTVKENIENKSFVLSDKAKSYLQISKYVQTHMMEKSSQETTIKTLKWVPIAISNAKRNLLGVYHKIKGKYLQLYLDEFCYKLNRRYFGHDLFKRLTFAVAKSYWYKCV